MLNAHFSLAQSHAGLRVNTQTWQVTLRCTTPIIRALHLWIVDRRFMITPTVVSTSHVSARERAPVWCELIKNRFDGLESDLYGDTAFDGKMTSLNAGEVILTRLEANRHRVIRSKHAGRYSDVAYLKIVAPVRGSAGVEQHGRRAWVSPGAWTIYDTTGSYAVGNPERVEHLIVMLPKSKIAEPKLRLDRLMARDAGGSSGIARVALATMHSTFDALPNMSADAANGAGDLIAQLVRQSLLELAGRPSESSQREILKDRIRGYIALNLRDSSLSVAQIALALNCSKRHLHNAFSTDTDTLSDHILRLRIEACIKEFRQPASQARPITDIALALGFCNMSHFSRVFRDHTGTSPSQFRLSLNLRNTNIRVTH